MNIRIHKALTFLTLFLTLILSAYPLTANADSMDNPVATEDEFFTALGRQMLNHKSQELYYISTEDLTQQITVSQNINDPFIYHYNPKEPLASGCYTSLAIHEISMTWFSNTNRTLNVQMKFRVPKDTMDSYYSEMKQLAADLKGENDYESVKAVHDYLIRRVEYDHSSVGENYTDIEGFRENRMVCQGYSMASYVLLSDMGIPVRIVIGKAGDEKNPQPHAWNVVQLDGKWYNYDATWDDAGGDQVNYTYFLKSNEDFPKHYPEGLYAKSEFTNMISPDSYEIPGSPFKSSLLILAVLIPWAIIFLILHVTKKSRSKSIGTVIEDDFSTYDPYMDDDKDISNDFDNNNIHNNYNMLNNTNNSINNFNNML